MFRIQITKLDAAKRQLETAIRLYFNDADPVSIHTLTGAAHSILSDLNKKCGGRPMLISDFPIKNEYRKEFKKIITEAKNYFKHADKDPDSTIEFCPDTNDHFLFDACEKYMELTSEKVAFFIIYKAWYANKYPGTIILSHDQNKKIGKSMKILCGNKAEFFSKMLSVTGGNV